MVVSPKIYKAVVHKNPKHDPYFSTVAIVEAGIQWLEEHQAMEQLVNWYDNHAHVVFVLNNRETALLLKLSF